MDINSIMSANLASLQQTVGLSVLNMAKNAETAQAAALIDQMESAAVQAPPSNHMIDVKV